jgi:perosamine synthetase
MKNIKKDVVTVLKKVLKKKTSLHSPYFFNGELEEVKKCIKSTYISSRGKYVKEFEKELGKIIKSKYVVAVNSGTSAIEIALRVIGVSSNDEVLVPSLTFVASVNAISYCGATPHFIDSSLQNLGIDADKLESYLSKNTYKKGSFFFNKKTKKRIFALMPVHVFGFPSLMSKIIQIAKNYNLKIIEDSTEGLGSKYYGKHVGTLGDIGTFSFNANKIITTGGGGAIVTNNKKFYKKALHLSSTSKVDHPWKYLHDQIGWNYRMPALNASLGLNQLRNFKKILMKKRKIAKNYQVCFEQTRIHFKMEEKNTEANYWLNTIILNENNMKKRDEIISFCNKKGFDCRPAWNLISEMKIYNKCPRADLKNAKILLNKIINLPSGVDILKNED